MGLRQHNMVNLPVIDSSLGLAVCHQHVQAGKVLGQNRAMALPQQIQ
jgi:hypothetical protein